MRQVSRALLFLACVVILPTLAHAQSSVAGIVRDPSGSVLPGVTVEAASPALIEKTRTTTTDGSGQYRITDLPPGTYVLTFSLSGFTSVKHEGLAISGSGVVAGECRAEVGNLTETITVTGESPLVDTQSTRRETVIKADTLATLPATRGYGSIIATVPALNIGGVAGAGATTAPTTPEMMFFTAHGGDSGEGRVHDQRADGGRRRSAAAASRRSRTTSPTPTRCRCSCRAASARPRPVDRASTSCRSPAAIGSAAAAFYSTAGDWSTSNNVDDELRAVGITTAADAAKELRRERQPGWSDQEGSAVVLRHPAAVGQRRGARWHLWQRVRRRSGPLGLSAADTASKPATQTAGRSGISGSPLRSRRSTVSQFSDDHQRRCSGSTLTVGGGGCRAAWRLTGWVRVGRSVPTPAHRNRGPATTIFRTTSTQVELHSAPLSSRCCSRRLLALRTTTIARFGMAPPDGLIDLIPVTEQTSVYGRTNFTYRGIFDPLDFAFNDNRRGPGLWRALGRVRDRLAQRQGRLSGLVLPTSAPAASPTTRSCATSFISSRNAVTNAITLNPINVGYYLTPRWDQHDRSTPTSACMRRTSGPAAG